ncbi:unnamed protein product, partial [Rodentolepis nana]|uniref:SH2 domain-containing protein n=1 Tax=Rodentolepis nana TaxID=102285 RepID=A0A0R3TFR2_RODNA
VTSPTKETTTQQTPFHPDERVIKIRSIEVSTSPYITTYSCKPVLRTTCLQAEFIKPYPKSPPPCASDQRPFLMSIGKVETASLFLTPRSVETSDKCTSPLTIPTVFNESPNSSDVLKIEVKQQTSDAAFWYRDDQDSTRLSNQVDLEYDTSLQQSDESLNMESEGLYEPVIKKPTHIPDKDGDLQRSTPVRISKCQSEVTEKLSAKGSVESKEFPTTQNQQNEGLVREDEDEDGNYNWLSVTSKAPLKYQMQPSPSPQKTIQKEGTQKEDTELISRNSDRHLRKLKIKSPPSIILRRNRDIANGVQSPTSPFSCSPLSKQVFSKAKDGITSTTPRIVDLASSKSGVLAHHQNGRGGSCSSIQSNTTHSPGDRNRPISDNDTSGITDVSYYPITRKPNNKDLEDFNKTGKELFTRNDNQTLLEFRKSIQAGESNSSDSSGISLNFTASNSVNTSLDMTTAPSQMSQEDEQLKELNASGAKAEISLIPPPRIDFAEISHQMSAKLPHFNDCLVVRKESEHGRYSSRGNFIISDLSIEETIKPDSQVTPRPRLEEDLKINPIPITRPHNLALETNHTKLTIIPSPTKNVTPSPEIPKVVSSLSKLSPSPTPDAFIAVNGVDKSPIPQKCLKSPKHLHSHTLNPDKTPVLKKSTPKSPGDQIFFPKSVKKSINSPTRTDTSSIGINENQGVGGIVSTNAEIKETQEDNTKKTMQSTKLTRSLHVNKRPQTVSEAFYNGRTL